MITWSIVALTPWVVRYRPDLMLMMLGMTEQEGVDYLCKELDLGRKYSAANPLDVKTLMMHLELLGEHGMKYCGTYPATD